MKFYTTEAEQQYRAELASPYFTAFRLTKLCGPGVTKGRPPVFGPVGMWVPPRAACKIQPRYLQVQGFLGVLIAIVRPQWRGIFDLTQNEAAIFGNNTLSLDGQGIYHISLNDDAMSTDSANPSKF